MNPFRQTARILMDPAQPVFEHSGIINSQELFRFFYCVLCDQVPIFVRKSMRVFLFKIAIRIAIKNRSGNIRIRFSFFDRIAFFSRKTLCDFFMKTGSRLKFQSQGAVAVGGRAGACMHKGLTFDKRIAIFFQKSLRVFSGKIDARFFVLNRIHDRD